jgi:phage baseplate assembly protein V
MSDLGKMLAPFARRLGNMLARGSVAAANGAGKMRTLQIRMMAEETKDNVEHFEPYGFTSEVMPGSEPIAAFFDGDRSHGVVLVVADRRYRLTGMKSGEVALYDDQGQKVYLTRTGIVINGANLPLVIQNVPTATIKAGTKVRFETPLLEVTGQIKDMSDSTGKTMLAMRSTYNGHTHHENDVHGETNNPTQQM